MALVRRDEFEQALQSYADSQVNNSLGNEINGQAATPALSQAEFQKQYNAAKSAGVSHDKAISEISKGRNYLAEAVSKSTNNSKRESGDNYLNKAISDTTGADASSIYGKNKLLNAAKRLGYMGAGTVEQFGGSLAEGVVDAAKYGAEVGARSFKGLTTQEEKVLGLANQTKGLNEDHFDTSIKWNDLDAASRGQMRRYGVNDEATYNEVMASAESKRERTNAAYNKIDSSYNQFMNDSLMGKAIQGLENRGEENLYKSTYGMADDTLGQKTIKLIMETAPSVVQMFGDAALFGPQGALGVMATRVFGQSYRKALQDGASNQKAAAYALSSAAIEYLSEIIGGESVMDRVLYNVDAGVFSSKIDKMIAKIPAKGLQKLALLAAQGTSEGLEEVFSELVSPLAEAILSDDYFHNAIVENYRNLDPEEVAKAFAGGAISAALGAGVDAAGNAVMRTGTNGIEQQLAEINKTKSIVDTYGEERANAIFADIDNTINKLAEDEEAAKQWAKKYNEYADDLNSVDVGSILYDNLNNPIAEVRQPSDKGFVVDFKDGHSETVIRIGNNGYIDPESSHVVSVLKSGGTFEQQSVMDDMRKFNEDLNAQMSQEEARRAAEARGTMDEVYESSDRTNAEPAPTNDVPFTAESHEEARARIAEEQKRQAEAEKGQKQESRSTTTTSTTLNENDANKANEAPSATYAKKIARALKKSNVATVKKYQNGYNAFVTENHGVYQIRFSKDANVDLNTDAVIEFTTDVDFDGALRNAWNQFQKKGITVADKIQNNEQKKGNVNNATETASTEQKTSTQVNTQEEAQKPAETVKPSENKQSKLIASTHEKVEAFIRNRNDKSFAEIQKYLHSLSTSELNGILSYEFKQKSTYLTEETIKLIEFELSDNSKESREVYRRNAEAEKAKQKEEPRYATLAQMEEAAKKNKEKVEWLKNKKEKVTDLEKIRKKNGLENKYNEFKMRDIESRMFELLEKLGIKQEKGKAGVLTRFEELLRRASNVQYEGVSFLGSKQDANYKSEAVSELGDSDSESKYDGSHADGEYLIDKNSNKEKSDSRLESGDVNTSSHDSGTFFESAARDTKSRRKEWEKKISGKEITPAMEDVTRRLIREEESAEANNRASTFFILLRDAIDDERVSKSETVRDAAEKISEWFNEEFGREYPIEDVMRTFNSFGFSRYGDVDLTIDGMYDVESKTVSEFTEIFDKWENGIWEEDARSRKLADLRKNGSKPIELSAEDEQIVKEISKLVNELEKYPSKHENANRARDYYGKGQRKETQDIDGNKFTREDRSNKPSIERPMRPFKSKTFDAITQRMNDFIAFFGREDAMEIMTDKEREKAIRAEVKDAYDKTRAAVEELINSGETYSNIEQILRDDRNSAIERYYKSNSAEERSNLMITARMLDKVLTNLNDSVKTARSEDIDSVLESYKERDDTIAKVVNAEGFDGLSGAQQDTVIALIDMIEYTIDEDSNIDYDWQSLSQILSMQGRGKDFSDTSASLVEALNFLFPEQEFLYDTDSREIHRARNAMNHDRLNQLLLHGARGKNETARAYTEGSRWSDAYIWKLAKEKAARYGSDKNGRLFSAMPARNIPKYLSSLSKKGISKNAGNSDSVRKDIFFGKSYAAHVATEHWNHIMSTDIIEKSKRFSEEYMAYLNETLDAIVKANGGNVLAAQQSEDYQKVQTLISEFKGVNEDGYSFSLGDAIGTVIGKDVFEGSNINKDDLNLSIKALTNAQPSEIIAEMVQRAFADQRNQFDYYEKAVKNLKKRGIDKPTPKQIVHEVTRLSRRSVELKDNRREGTDASWLSTNEYASEQAPNTKTLNGEDAETYGGKIVNSERKKDAQISALNANSTVDEDGNVLPAEGYAESIKDIPSIADEASKSKASSASELQSRPSFEGLKSDVERWNGYTYNQLREMYRTGIDPKTGLRLKNNKEYNQREALEALLYKKGLLVKAVTKKEAARLNSVINNITQEVANENTGNGESISDATRTGRGESGERSSLGENAVERLGSILGILGQGKKTDNGNSRAEVGRNDARNDGQGNRNGEGWASRRLTRDKNAEEADRSNEERRAANRKLHVEFVEAYQKIASSKNSKIEIDSPGGLEIRKAAFDEISKRDGYNRRNASDTQILTKNSISLEEAAKYDKRFNKAIKFVNKYDIDVEICEAFIGVKTENYKTAKTASIEYIDNEGAMHIIAGDYNSLAHELWHARVELALDYLFDPSKNNRQEQESKTRRFLSEQLELCFEEAGIKKDDVYNILKQNYSEYSIDEDVFVELAASYYEDRYSSWGFDEYAKALKEKSKTFKRLMGTINSAADGDRKSWLDGKNGIKYMKDIDNNDIDMSKYERVFDDVGVLYRNKETNETYRPVKSENGEYILKEEAPKGEARSTADNMKQKTSSDTSEETRKTSSKSTPDIDIDDDTDRFSTITDEDAPPESTQQAPPKPSESQNADFYKKMKDYSDRVRKSMSSWDRASIKDKFKDADGFKQASKAHGAFRQNIQKAMTGQMTAAEFISYLDANKRQYDTKGKLSSNGTRGVSEYITEDLYKLWKKVADKEAGIESEDASDYKLMSYEEALETASKATAFRVEQYDKFQRDVAMPIAESIEAHKKKRADSPEKTFSDWFLTMQMSDVNMFKQMGGFKKHGAAYRMSNRIMQHHADKQRVAYKLQSFYNEIANDKEYADFLKGKEKHTFNIVGTEKELDAQQAITLLMVMDTMAMTEGSEKASWARMASANGIALRNIKGEDDFIDIKKSEPTPMLDKDGNKVLDKSGAPIMRTIDDDLDNLYASLYNYVKGDAKLAKYYEMTASMFEAAAQEVTKTQESMLGYSKKMMGKYTYAPIHYANKGSSINDWVMNPSDSGYSPGLANERTRKSGGYIVVDDINKVVDSYINQVSNYVAYSELGLQLNDMLAENSFAGNLSTVLGENFGKNYSRWIENYSKSINQIHEQTEVDSWLAKMREATNVGTLAFSLSVPIKQTPSYWSAGSELSMQSLVKARKWIIGSSGNTKNNYLVQGRGNSGISQLLDQNVAQKLSEKSKLMKAFVDATNTMDKRTVDNLYKACMIEMATQNPGIDQNSKVFESMVNAKFEKVVMLTQPNFNTKARAEYHRTDNEIIKLFSTFRTQQTQNFNAMYGAINEYLADKTPETRKRMVGAVTSQLAAASSFAALSILADFVLHKKKKYQDDDDEVDVAKMLERFGLNAVESLAGNWWGASDLLKLAIDKIDGNDYNGKEFYGVNASFVSQWYSALKYMGAFINDGNPTTLRYAANNIASSFGIPLGNAYNVINSFVMWNKDIATAVTGTKVDYYDDLLTNIYKYHTNKGNKLYNALNNGNDTKAEKIVEDMGDTFLTQIKDESMRRLERGTATPQEIQYVLEYYGDMNRKDAENWLKNARGYIDTGYKSQTDVKDKFIDGKIKASDAIDYMVSYQDKSVEDAQKTLAEWKFAVDHKGMTYGKMEHYYQIGKISEDEAVAYLMDYGSMTQEKAEAKVKNWVYEANTGIDYEELSSGYVNGDYSDNDVIKARMDMAGDTKEEATLYLNQQKFKQEYGVAYTNLKKLYLDGTIDGNTAKGWYEKVYGNDGSNWLAKLKFYEQTGYESTTTFNSTFNDHYATKEHMGAKTFYDNYGTQFKGKGTFAEVMMAIDNRYDVGADETKYVYNQSKGWGASKGQAGAIELLNKYISQGKISYETAKLIWTQYCGWSAKSSNAWQYVHK